MRRVGADGRALSRCVECGTWLVVNQLEDGHLEIRTADELVGKRSILALEYADWQEGVSEREIMPLGVSVSAVDLPAAYDPRHADTDPGALADLLDDGEIGFDLGETHEATDPGIGDTAGSSVNDSGGFAPEAPTALKSLAPVAPTAVTAPAEELPESAYMASAPKADFFPEAELHIEPPGPKPELGALDMQLPDPRRRRRSRIEVQQMLTEFSVMFRLDTRVRQRRTLLTTAIVVAICGAIVAFVALRASQNLPAEAVEMRTLATSLHAAHSLAVPHTVEANDGSGAKVKRTLSMLATQLRQLHKTGTPPAAKDDGELKDGQAPAPIGSGR